MSQPMMLEYGFTGDSKYGRYYKHSGQINVGGVFAALVAGMIVGAAMAPIYSALVVFIPSVKLRVCALILYGLGMGALPTLLLKKFKVRNLPVSLAVVGVATLFSYYMSWASWEAILLRNARVSPSLFEIASNPLWVIRMAIKINEIGTWTMSSAPSSSSSPRQMENGTFLLVIWIIEALSLFGTALALTRTMLHELPFCEKCVQWCSKPKFVRSTVPVDGKLLKGKLESGDFSYVASLPSASAGTFFEYSFQRCDKCGQLNTLSVFSRTITRDKKGRVRKQAKKAVISKLLVSDEDIARMSPGAAIPVAVAAPLPIIPITPPPTAPMRKSPQSL